MRNNAFNIANNPKYDGYQRGLATMVYKRFDKKSSDSGITNRICQTSNELKNYTNQSLETFRKEKYTDLAYTTSGCRSGRYPVNKQD